MPRAIPANPPNPADRAAPSPLGGRFPFTAEQFRALSPRGREMLVATLDERQLDFLKHAWEFWARPEQLTPPGEWFIWLILAGRGFGKTRTGAEEVRARVKRGYRRIALLGKTADDIRDVMIEGESGVLAICPSRERPKYEPSKRRLTWPCGAQATGYSAEDKEQLRGKQHDFAWLDELCAWSYFEPYDHVKLGLRLGRGYGIRPQMLVTTTPKPIPLLKRLVARPDVQITRGSTWANAANLAPEFLREMEMDYKGTRLGRQELEGKLLMDMPGALWTEKVLEAQRIIPGARRGGLPVLPYGAQVYRIAVGVDPAGRIDDMARFAAGLSPSGARRAEGDECGIVVAGRADDDKGYVLEDCSTGGSPEAWGNAAVDAYLRWGADVIDLEYNHGGEAAEQVIEAVARNRGTRVNVRRVWASKGKYTRAEPISALYEQGRVHHVGEAEDFAALEDEMTTFVPGKPSPNRLDAAVFALTDLMLVPEDQGGAVAGGSDAWRDVPLFG